jgi:hypothetical protein
MRDVSAPPLQGRSYGRQLREALDRIEGLVVDGLRHGFFDYSIACEIGKDSKRRHPGGQEPQVHYPRRGSAALTRRQSAIPGMGMLKMQIT